MKNKLKISTVVLALFGFVAVQTTVAQAANTSPAQEALKGMRPFIGNWAGESDSFGGFEGLEGVGKILWEQRYRWLQNKAAVEYTWQSKYKNTGKNFTSGSQIISLDAATGKLRTIGYGHDGSVYWSNTGSIEIEGKSFTQVVNEITINKTKSKYTVKYTKETPKALSFRVTESVVDGKKQKDLLIKLHRVSKSARTTQSAVSADEAEKITEELTRLTKQWSKVHITKDFDHLRRIWADDFSYTDNDGKVDKREDGFAFFEDNTDTFTSSGVVAFNLRVYGKNFAIGNGDHHEAGKDKDGKPFSRKFRFTNVWVRKQNVYGERKWQVVRGHASLLE
jgi:ketosteroid isomerase-like protein